ncbi:hypothetical protein AS033_02035 [Exiguobacterium indicum]|uniref:AAA+ ATPase domain-containing protein n=1 Tax=Exiguobacterium indicum TaxID=296995 RepID=A0A0V8GJ66_9BACL|nr:AAA family ATPase [Exiguobacterium enclense]KSU50177.1 hypothetical protein AS033_02035 [Exiguobacterium enclense]SDB90259.1 AAA domain-containing protein, putative AbiEii toxin, Type IV TA system [Exiguobacterium enclense]
MFITQSNRNFYENNNYQLQNNEESFFSLVKNNWNDYGFETTFQLDYFNNGKYIDIGIINILNSENNSTRHVIPDKFSELTEEYVSLGGSEEFYENIIRAVGKDEAKQILIKLNDIAIIGLENNKYFNLYSEGIQKSFFRSTKGRYLYQEVLKKYFLSENIQERDYKFIFKSKIYSDNQEIKEIDIDFNKKNDYLPNRIFTIIGKNGVGKTRILNQLAESLFDSSKPENKDRFILDSDNSKSDNIPIYNKIIAISFSVFDKFYKGSLKNNIFNKNDVESEEKTKFNNYVYIGLHKIDDTIYSTQELSKINERAFKKIINKGRKDLFIEIINSSDILQNELNDDVNFENFFKTSFSSGQNIYISMICRLLSEIEDGSLIFLDEPELYLHPNAISNLMRVYYQILESFKSYAIMCTHSPILVQEMPSNFVRKLSMVDNDLINYSLPNIETFGSNISEITSDIFNVLDNESLYKSRLKKWISNDNLSEEEIFKIFNNKLSFKAQLYISSLFEEKK